MTHCPSNCLRSESIPGHNLMRAAYQGTDWSQTALGPQQLWDPALKVAVDICLDSLFPLLILGGPDLVCIYNDAVIPAMGGKHPLAFGKKAADIWPETWDAIRPMLETVQRTGRAVRYDDLPLLVRKREATERFYFTFSYSPVISASGDVVAVFVAVLETTVRVEQMRRQNMLNKLATAIARTTDRQQTFDGVQAALLSNPDDLPLAVLYTRDQAGALRRLVLASRSSCADERFPALVTGETASGPAFLAIEQCIGLDRVQLFHFGQALHTDDGVTIEKGAVLPIRLPETLGLRACLLVGLAPLVPADDEYLAYLVLIVGQLGTAIAASETAREAQSFLSIVFHAAPSGIAITDPAGRLVQCNAAYARLLGLSEEDIQGKLAKQLTYPPDWPEKRHRMHQLLLGAENQVQLESRYIRADGAVEWVNETMALIRDGEGLPKFIVTIAKDITHRVLAQQRAQAAERELRTLYDRLQIIREDERVSIAREVHDQLGQTLSAAKIDIDLLRLKLQDPVQPPGRDAMLTELQSAQSSLEDALQLVRSITSELRAPMLHERGLFGAIQWHAEDFARRTRTRCEVHIAEGLQQPDGELAVALFRIVQEALTNVLRHAGASEASICIDARGPAPYCGSGTMDVAWRALACARWLRMASAACASARPCCVDGCW